MGARKLEHGVVPTATGEHGEDDDEAVEEGVEVELEGVRLRYWGQVHRRVKKKQCLHKDTDFITKIYVAHTAILRATAMSTLR